MTTPTEEQSSKMKTLLCFSKQRTLKTDFTLSRISGIAAAARRALLLSSRVRLMGCEGSCGRGTALSGNCGCSGCRAQVQHVVAASGTLLCLCVRVHSYVWRAASPAVTPQVLHRASAGAGSQHPGLAAQDQKTALQVLVRGLCHRPCRPALLPRCRVGFWKPGCAELGRGWRLHRT